MLWFGHVKFVHKWGNKKETDKITSWTRKGRIFLKNRCKVRREEVKKDKVIKIRKCKWKIKRSKSSENV